MSVEKVKDINGRVKPKTEVTFVDSIDSYLDSKYVTKDFISGRTIIKNNDISRQADVSGKLRNVTPIVTNVTKILANESLTNDDYSYTLESFKDLKNDYIVMFYDKRGRNHQTLKSSLDETDLFQESLYDGAFYLKDNKDGHFDKKGRYHKFNNVFKYDPKDIKKSIEMGTFSPTFRITEGKKHTFGVELETSIGILQPWHYKDLNIDAVHDGSLRGPNGEDPTGGEYVTGILTGDMGFNQINKICSILSKRCEIDKRCGVHVHVGIKPTNSFIVNLYKLLLDIQNEIWSMMPHTRRNGKYCKNLYKLDFSRLASAKTEEEYELITNDLFAQIYKFINVEPVIKTENGVGMYSKQTSHPLGDKCGYNSDTPRYCWVNFVPALFIRRDYISKGKKPKDYTGYTIEFRPHPGSLNYTKIKNWIKICIAIVSFVENNEDYISKNKVTLDKIIRSEYPKSSIKLLDFVRSRQELFASKQAEDFSTDYTDKNQTLTELTS